MRGQILKLEQKLSLAKEEGRLPEIPKSINDNLNPLFQLRAYQIETFSRFIYCFNSSAYRQKLQADKTTKRSHKTSRKTRNKKK